MDRQAAEWVVRIWADVVGYDIPIIQQPYMEIKSQKTANEIQISDIKPKENLIKLQKNSSIL